MPVNAGDDPPNLRQLDMVVSVKSELIIRGNSCAQCAQRSARLSTIRSGLSANARKTPGRPLCFFAGAVRCGRLSPLRRRYRGIVRGLGRLAELGFEFGDTPGQFRNLLRLRLDLRRLRQPQRDQLVPGEFREAIPIHPQVESRKYTPVNQNLYVYRPRPTICATRPHRPGPHPARG